MFWFLLTIYLSLVVAALLYHRFTEPIPSIVKWAVDETVEWRKNSVQFAKGFSGPPYLMLFRAWPEYRPKYHNEHVWYFLGEYIGTLAVLTFILTLVFAAAITLDLSLL